MNRQHEHALLQASRTAIKQSKPEYESQFDFTVAVAEDYDELLSAEFRRPSVQLDELLEDARTVGRVLISAPAGQGKTSLTWQLADAALEIGWPVIRVDLRRWTPSVERRWREATESATARMALLLREIAAPQVSESDLAVATERDCLVIVDGLNEIPGQLAPSVLWVLDAFAARRPFASVVVCDRFQRRSLPSAEWHLATITRVGAPHTNAREGRNALLLDIAGDTLATSSEASILLSHVSSAAPDADPSVLAETAFDLYKEGGSRYFPFHVMVERAGEAVASSLRETGLLIQDGEYAYFRHHLFHDALAASWVASNPAEWNGTTFDALTFDANSFDAVALTLELLSDQPSADRFLAAVYNWNHYASVYALSQGREANTICVSESLELALLGVVAQRRWDPIAPTAERNEDALRVFPGEFARRLRHAKNQDEVRALVGERAGTLEQPPGWLSVFLGQEEPAELILTLGGDEYLGGWMAANTLRDVELSPLDLESVERGLDHAERDVRWRTAHVLGAHPSEETARRLLDALDGDADKWVRYGAVRSLVEQAGRGNPELRSWILTRLAERVQLIREDGLVRSELEKSLQLRDPPIGWAAAVEPLLIELFATSVTILDQDHWRRVGQRVTDSIRAARETAAPR